MIWEIRMHRATAQRPVLSGELRQQPQGPTLPYVSHFEDGEHRAGGHVVVIPGGSIDPGDVEDLTEEDPITNFLEAVCETSLDMATWEISLGSMVGATA